MSLKGTCVAADTDHVFEGRENDWGFTSFASLQDLLSPDKGFLHNGALHLKVLIEVEHPDNYLYNSKKKTGFVGLKNQGATCYLNSLLQTLYNINYFRKVCHNLSVRSSPSLQPHNLGRHKEDGLCSSCVQAIKQAEMNAQNASCEVVSGCSLLDSHLLGEIVARL